MQLFDPIACFIDADKGILTNKTGRYEKTFRDLFNIYEDEKAFQAMLGEYGDKVVYHVEEFRPSEQLGDLIFGITHMEAGNVGGEYFMTRGHIHKIANRPEIYFGQQGEGLMLMESPEGLVKIVEITPGIVCYVPPYWIHRSINTGDAPFVTMFCYPSDSGQDYNIISNSGGMKSRIFQSNNSEKKWVEKSNPAYQARSSSTVSAVYSA